MLEVLTGSTISWLRHFVPTCTIVVYDKAKTKTKNLIVGKNLIASEQKNRPIRGYG